MGFRDQFRTHAFVHLGWIIAVLSSVIVVLVSVKIGSTDSIKDIINTSLMLSSLVLAVLAIIQALISGGALNDVVATLRSEINQIKDPAKSLEIAASLLSARSEQIGESAKQFTDYLASNSRGAENNREILGAKPTEEPDIREVLRRSSIGVKLAYYCCARSFETGIAIEVEQIANKPSIIGFLNGALSTIRSAGEIQMTYSEKKFTIQDLGEMQWIVKNKDLLVESKSLAKFKVSVDNFFDIEASPATE